MTPDNLPTPIAVMIGQLVQGGSERQLYAFLKHCDRERWQPIVYVGGGPSGFWDKHILELGIPIELLEGHPVTRMWDFRRSSIAHGIRTFFSWSAHTNRYGLAMLGLNARRIGSYRNAYSPDLPFNHRRLRAWLRLASVTTIVCNSEETVTALRRRVCQHKNVIYVPNSVEPVHDAQYQYHREQWRRKLGLSADEILIVGVGRLSRQKAFGRFVEMVALVQQVTPVKAVVAGRDDGCLPKLQKLTESLGIESVLRFTGPVPDARELMCAADIFVLSSDFEGMPNVIMEAMAAGVPCVSTRVNGVSALIKQGTNGFITEHDAEALASRVVQLCQDRDLRIRMGTRAKEVVKDCDPQTIAVRLWALCE